MTTRVPAAMLLFSLAAAAIAAMLSEPSAAADIAAAPQQPDPAGPHKFTRVISHGRVLDHPATQPQHTSRPTSYELGKLVQLDVAHVLLTASLREQGAQDFCVGNDGFVFRTLDDISPARAIPINRPVANYQLKSGKGSGVQAKYPGTAGFVPLGAVMPDGSLHPGAGKGFYFSTAVTFLENRERMHPQADWWVEFLQMSWDGERFSATPDQLPTDEQLGFHLLNIGFRSLPHEGGFLFPAVSDEGIVVLRLEFADDRWRIVRSGQPFEKSKGEFEPCIVKTEDGFLLYTRGRGAQGRLYRSTDGLNYTFVSEHPNHTVPQAFNQGLDGSLYLATNTQPQRNPLAAYAYADGKFVEPLILHDEKSPDVKVPFADHCIAANVLFEGRPRHLMPYRVCDRAETDGHGAPPTSRTGLYLLELEYTSALPLPFGLKPSPAR